MKNIYIKLVIAGRNIATVPARDIVGVAAGVIIKGAEIAALEADGYDENGDPVE